LLLNQGAELVNVHPGVEHDFFLIASGYQRSANSDSELIEVKEDSLFVGGPISLLYGDKPHSFAYPRVGSVLPFHIYLLMVVPSQLAFAYWRLLDSIHRST
jgi:hypothetical protein